LVPVAPDLAHATFAELGDDAVMGDGVAGIHCASFLA
jgi:hypothetical protein